MTLAAVITGIGVVAPTGTGVRQHWENTLAGRSGIAPITTFDASGLPVAVAGQVADFVEAEWVDHRLIVQTDRWTWLAFAAARLALDDARLDPAEENPMALSVVTAGGSGGNAFGQREIQALWQEGPRAVSAYQSIGWFYAASSGQLSIRHQLKGACGVLVADGAGGIDALRQARRLLARGSAGVLTGGTEAPLSPYALACQSGQRGLSHGSDPNTAYRPFAADATGHVPGEGGAMLFLEPEAKARARGARVYAEVSGTASTHDAWHPEDPPPDSRQLERAVRESIVRAGCVPDDIDVVFADGAGGVRADRLELDALRAVFAGRRVPVPVTVPKTMTGRLCSGGAALDLAWAALAIDRGMLPPTVNVPADALGSGLDLVTEARPADVRYALVVARGVGGFNSAAVLRRSAPEMEK